MSLECGECERDSRGPHNETCSRFVPMVRLVGKNFNQEQPQLWARRGLAVSPGWDGNRFTVTHINSGTRVGLFAGKTAAIGFARKAVKVADWTFKLGKARFTKAQGAELAMLLAAFDSIVILETP